MARRRPTPAKSSKKNRKSSNDGFVPSRYHVESLEDRRMFVVLHGGDVFEFWAENTHMERVVVTGNTTVELLGTDVAEATGLSPGDAITLNTMRGQIFSGPDAGVVGAGLPPEAFPNANGGAGPGGVTTASRANIYQIYVSQSDVNSSIAISAVPNLDAPQRNMLPFTGSETLFVLNNNTGQPYATTEPGSGDVLIGAQLFPTQGNGGGGNTNNNFPTNRPVVAQATVPSNAVTIVPGSRIGPGLTVTAGNNLGEFLLGGTMTGTVNIHGSINLFYCGWLVTGLASGSNGFAGGLGTGFGSPAVPNNFNVDGDIHTLLVNGSIGTDSPTGEVNLADLARRNYTSGFDMRVGGKLGEIKTFDAFSGNVNVLHSPTAPSIDGTPYIGYDLRGPANFDPFDQGSFGGDPLVNGTAPTGAQFLGPIDSSGTVEVSNTLQAFAPEAKAQDYYAVSLLAGQTVTVSTSSDQLPSTAGQVSIGVFDAEQRLIATDNNNVDANQSAGQPYQVTAKTPGIYYFAVTPFGNTLFNPAVLAGGGFTYTLKITNVGDIGLAAIVATNQIQDLGGSQQSASSATLGSGFHVAKGDFGALYAPTGILLSNDGGQAFAATGRATSNNPDVATIAVDNGNLRAVQAVSIGNGVQAAPLGYSEGLTGYVPNGSVGLLQASGQAIVTGQGGTSVLIWNQFMTSADVLTGALSELTTAEAAAVAIGGDYQMVQAFGFFAGDLVAKGNIGTVRANSMATAEPSYFQVNSANDLSKHGTIDLIDVATAIGTLSSGGPAITTGPGGNVRYIHLNTLGLSVQGAPAYFRDLAFGGGAPESTLFQPGETATITDDSGSLVNITPQNAADQVDISTYPIRGSGGSAIVYVEVTNAPNAGPEPASHSAAQGVNITSSGGVAEIGSIIVDGLGTAPTNAAVPTTTPGTGTGATTTTQFPAPGTPGGAPVTAAGGTNPQFLLPTLPASPTIPANTAPIDINISGSSKIDVYEITGPELTTDGSLNTGFGSVTSIKNSTPGEIVNIHLSNIGDLSAAGAVGYAVEHNTPASVEGNIRTHHVEDAQSGAPYSYPLYLTSSIVRVIGRIVSFSAAGGIGNAYVGIITQTPIQDPVPLPFTPPLAIPAASNYTPNGTASVGSISGPVIGAFVSAGGINRASLNGVGWFGSGSTYSTGVFTNGILGPVTDSGDIRGIISTELGNSGISMRSGSIIGAVIGTLARFDYAEVTSPAFVIPTAVTPISRPVLDIGPISISGNGGIIGALIVGNHAGPINVSDSGFGVFDSHISLNGNGTLAGISTGGYGIRGGFFSGGATIGNITARGNGSTLPVSAYSSIVRQSETGTTFDSKTGQPISFLNDIDVYLGTNANVPVIAGVTDSGVIEDFVLAGSRDLKSVSAWSIRGRQLSNPLVPGFVLASSQVTSTTFNIADQLANLSVTGPINGFSLTTGRTTKYTFGGNVANFAMTVAGPIGDLIFKSGLLGTSTIQAIGPSGKIKSLTVNGNFNGTIKSTISIGTITIRGSLSGIVQSRTVGTLKFTGGLGQGSLQIIGNIGTIQSTGDLGVAGNTLTINGSLRTLKVGRNLNTGISIAKNLGTFTVGGSILDAAIVSIGGSLNSITVNGDVDAGAIVKAHIIKKRLIRGQLLGTITTA